MKIPRKKVSFLFIEYMKNFVITCDFTKFTNQR